MKKIYLTISFLLAVIISAQAQYLQQYFDGADTTYYSLKVKLDTATTNIWQVGPPQKIIFDSASTDPNVLITDTINDYPVNNTSSFHFTVVPFNTFGVMAIQWKQKLDMDLQHDGGIIEYSIDTGATWHNVFNDPHVYNVYGFLPANMDTLLTGEYAFSGTDSTWRNVWLCFDMSWLTFNDSINIRFTFKSDSINNNKEGWMIDNMIVHASPMHPVREVNNTDYVNLYPNPAKNIINIEIQKIQRFHIIEHMELVNSTGITVKQWKNIPVKYWFDTSEFPDGIYYLKVKTNVKSETIPFIIKKN